MHYTFHCNTFGKEYNSKTQKIRKKWDFLEISKQHMFLSREQIGFQGFRTESFVPKVGERAGWRKSAGESEPVHLPSTNNPPQIILYFPKFKLVIMRKIRTFQGWFIIMRVRLCGQSRIKIGGKNIKTANSEEFILPILT